MTNSQSSAKNTAHLLYLDSARGIAAWMVVIFHYIYWKYADALSAKLSFFVFNGIDAVSFFFVLSGLVLSYKYLQLRAPLDIRSFFVNRFIRLFPGYFITIIANFVYAHRADLGLHSLRDMFVKNTGGFWEEALLIRRHNTFFPPGWTMNMELSASLLLPFAIILFKTNKKLIPWLIFFCLLTGDSIIKIMFVHFLLGLLIAGYFTDIRGDAFKQRKVYRYRYWIIGAAFVLFSLRQIDRISMLGPSLTYITAGYLDFDFFLCSGIAAAIFLGWLVSSPHLQRWITGRILLFFGKISYGIYLMHWLVLLIIINNWDAISRIMPDEGIRFSVMLLVCIAGTILSATLLYYFIELPAICWGKRLTARWSPAVVV